MGFLTNKVCKSRERNLIRFSNSYHRNRNLVDNIWNHPFLNVDGNWCNAIKIELNNEKDESLQTISVHHRLIGHFSYSDNGADESQTRVCH